MLALAAITNVGYGTIFYSFSILLGEDAAAGEFVACVLGAHGVPVTALRAGLIVGAGGSSLEIMVRLVQRLPAMICPAWMRMRTQPIDLDDGIHAGIDGPLLTNPISSTAAAQTTTTKSHWFPTRHAKLLHINHHHSAIDDRPVHNGRIHRLLANIEHCNNNNNNEAHIAGCQVQ